MIYLTFLVPLVAVAWGLARFWRMIPLGAAYKAKALCSAVFVSGRNVDPEHGDDVSADSYRMMRLLRAEVDRSGGSVTVSWLGWQARKAVHRAGLGATLDFGTPLPRIECPTPAPLVDADWLAGDTPPPLRQVVDDAFLESNPSRLRRTRAVLVVSDDRIVAEHYAPGFSLNTPFPGWSMSKSVLGALVGILVGQGRLSLDQRALLPTWSAPGDDRGQITLEDLLRMRSGLAFDEVYSNPFSDVVRMLFACPDAAGFAAAKPLAYRPGTHWNYSSGTTNILSRIVRSRVGEKDYLWFPRRALFDPLSMRSAIMEPDASGTFVCSSFTLASARDWARFGQLYLHDGVWEGRRLLPEGWVSFSVSPTAQSDGCYGAHWWLRLQKELGGETAAAARIPTDAFYALGHEGQTLTVIPSRRVVIVRLGLSIYIDAWDHARFVSDVLAALA